MVGLGLSCFIAFLMFGILYPIPVTLLTLFIGAAYIAYIIWSTQVSEEKDK